MCDLCNLLVKTIKYTLEFRNNKLLLNYSLLQQIILIKLVTSNLCNKAVNNC